MSDRFVGRKVPQHEAEEVEVDRAVVEQHELRVGERRRALPVRDVDVARRQLDDVHARQRAQQVAVVLRRRARSTSLVTTLIVAGASISAASDFVALTTMVSVRLPSARLMTGTSTFAPLTTTSRVFGREARKASRRPCSAVREVGEAVSAARS
jgi:hypothetical protein